ISGVNGPGPFKILNNYLQASGENIMFGGGAPSIPGLVPSDIEIRGNTLIKPLTWRVEDPSYAGKHWTIKNLFELKTGRRVLLDGNTLENCWADLPIGQSGYAILLTVRAEGGLSPQADVSDVTISNNTIRNVAAGISLSGTDDITSNRSSRIHITNNLFSNINGPAFGDGNDAGPNVGTFLKIGDPTNVTVSNNTVEQTGSITWAIKPMTGFVFVNNRVNCFRSSGGYQGMYGPGKAEGNSSIAFFFPDITDANKRFDNNALIGGKASLYTNYATISKNMFPASASLVPDEIGADQTMIDSAFAWREACGVVSGVADGNEQHTSFTVFPNPATEEVTVHTPNNFFGTVFITDVVGRTVYSGSYMTGERRIHVGQLPHGLYYVHIVSVGNVTAVALIVTQ
ncbi:MAG: T9SS type A sorting domain-containing protein, partial [Candidatus Kapabacteria bacterium]|nr:T9SS type A sorting domain-containing protein [Candidatus Kapabacteria bacterium]